MLISLGGVIPSDPGDLVGNRRWPIKVTRSRGKCKAADNRLIPGVDWVIITEP
jgi:hypothetical protein